MDFKKDFPMLNNNIIYMDNAATSFKPNCVIESVCNYYKNYCANAHRGDYSISLKVDELYEEARSKVKKFINAEKECEVVFTSGTTESLNMVIKGFLTDYLKKDDEIITTKAEHASLLLPLFDVCKKTDSKIKYVELNDDYSVSINSVINLITNKTKVIALAQITNVIGDVRPIKEIIKFAHEKGIIVIIDAAQSVPHQKVDVRDLDADFLAFSAHKMLGPTGVGVLYGKEKYLSKIKPLNLGGGMNSSFDSFMNYEWKMLPHRLEAGTPNIAGVIGLSSAIDYINDLGLDNIHKYEVDLKKYLVSQLSNLDNVKIYNPNHENGLVTFNVDSVFAQDVAAYLDKKNICIRVGSHCAKILYEALGVKNTCRVSLYFYNTKEEVDKLVEALKNKNILFESL